MVKEVPYPLTVPTYLSTSPPYLPPTHPPYPPYLPTYPPYLLRAFQEAGLVGGVIGVGIIAAMSCTTIILLIRWVDTYVGRYVGRWSVIPAACLVGVNR